MKICTECSRSPLPYIMVVFVSSVSAFLTWLTLTYSEFETSALVAATCGVFLAVAVTLLHYVLSCIRRHCRHDSQAERS
jgi:hypothetical protein